MKRSPMPARAKRLTRAAWKGGEVFDVEEATGAFDPIILVRRRDGARYEVDVTVSAWPVREQVKA